MDNIETLLKLKRDNPDLEIVPMVDTDVVAGDEHAWWIGKFGKASVEEIYSDEQRERVYVKSTDEDVLIDEILNELDPEMDDHAAEKYAESIVDAYDWKKVIAVNIHL